MWQFAAPIKRRIAEAGEGDDSGTFTWDDRLARWEFAGVREVLKVGDSKESEIRDGIEVTYSRFILPDVAALENLVAGEIVSVLYEI